MTEVVAGGRPPRVLICHSSPEMAGKLRREITKNSLVDSAEVTLSLEEAKVALDSRTFDITFLGLLSFELSESSEFMFATRKERPSIVFALYEDSTEFELASTGFQGRLSRLSHYYRLNQALDGKAFGVELRAVLILCMMDLGISIRG